MSAAVLPDTLRVRLHGRTVGVVSRLPGDQHVFAFERAYADDPERPTLGLYFTDPLGRLLVDLRPERGRLPPFFSNLLPEGLLLKYLAERAGIRPGDEYALLAALGADLPGAVAVEPAGEAPALGAAAARGPRRPMRFSLAGMQLKFSARADRRKRLTIPVDGEGGSWIVKLSPRRFPAVAENEFAMTALAGRAGIAVPEARLLPTAEIRGLPAAAAERMEARALAVRRFDRTDGGGRVHMEDFAQVFGQHPEDKYARRSCADIARVLDAAAGRGDALECVRRVVFCMLIGNGDMHLKNWSLLYPDGRAPALSPAYDLLSTVAYLPGDDFALPFGGTTELGRLDRGRADEFAAQAGLLAAEVWRVVEETVERTRDAWRGLEQKDRMLAKHRRTVDLRLRAGLAPKPARR